MMCGIAGIFRFDQNTVNIDELKYILHKLEHRGRDHQGVASIHHRLALGHRRLSIIDLNDNANLPMFLDKHLCLTYNGEIYNYLDLKKRLRQHNYQFKTESDSEVLLAAYDHWGENCVKHLNGMFAFAIWDNNKQQLFCARDHLGIKPFYYIKTSRFLAFASESRALAHYVNKQINSKALYLYFLSMYVANQESIYTSIQQLAPAHSLTFKGNGEHILQRYWQVQEFETHSYQEGEYKEQLKSELERAIKLQLQSDVPVGGFLSGGIDSGVITAIAARSSARYYTYSIGYEGLLDKENELPIAKKIAQRYETIHTEVFLEAKHAMPYLKSALQHLSEPLADPAIIGTYILSARARLDGVKVLLNGTGGDEIFSGYTRYTGGVSAKRKLFLHMPRWTKFLMSCLPLKNKTKLRIQYLPLDMLFSTGGSFPLAEKMLKCKREEVKRLKEVACALNLKEYRHQSLLYQRMLFDMHCYLPNELLFLLDQMTMAHTLEGRVPLLDINIVKNAFQFKGSDHIQGGRTTKAILKDIALPYLGKNHVERKKQGFAGSTHWWVKNNFAEFIEGISDINKIDGFEYFNLDDYCHFEKLNSALSNDIFILFCFNVWYQKNVKAI